MLGGAHIPHHGLAHMDADAKGHRLAKLPLKLPRQHLRALSHIRRRPHGVHDIMATILYAACLAVNYVQAARERRLVREKFNHYVAPEIVDEILKRGAFMT